MGQLGPPDVLRHVHQQLIAQTGDANLSVASDQAVNDPKLADVEVFSSPKSAWFNIELLPTLQIQEEHGKMERQHCKIHQHVQKKWESCLLILFSHTHKWQNMGVSENGAYLQ